ncbi:type I restriction endonuclease [Turicimonas muris]|uniref:type I restriction endonuclease n=1 Tax=Turicimonas muris TaxID=1796652 RepID=UPI0025A5C7C4|nr:type I restriction endonuclease [Turicimonas muris]
MSKIYESDFEEAIVEKLKQEGWMHSRGDDINRGLDEALLTEDLRDYLATLPLLSPLTESEIQRIIANLRNTASTTDYLTSRAVFQLIQNGFTFERDDTSLPAIHIDYLNFDRTEGNIFKVINQLTMRERGQERRPDVLLYVNGIPLCIMELKNPSDEGATVLSAWEQIHM